METSYEHLPVMCEEILSLIAPALSDPDAVFVDATLGLGGHAAAVLARFPTVRVIGIDRDRQAIDLASERLADQADRFSAVEATFDQIGEIVRSRVGGPVAAILFDLGLSSLQIDAPERGFAYAFDAPLSMRMDADATQLNAADIVNHYPLDALARIFRVHADEKHALRIAKAIVAERERAPFSSSARLVETIVGAVPAHQPRAGHPAKRVFQALRMEVNDERALLEDGLPAGLAALGPAGRLAVLSYHSGEDRLVKQLFREATSDQVPVGVPIVPRQYQAGYRLVTRGALKPSPAEIETNRRAASARLRVIERMEEAR